MLRFAALCLVLAFALPPAALLATPHPGAPGLDLRGATPPHQEKREERAEGVLDLDGDGLVSEDEARRYYAWIFDLLDRDRDGGVVRAEFVDALLGTSPRGGDRERVEGRIERLGTLFRRLDSDDDGRLTEAEFMRACHAHFVSSDDDGDGSVSVREFRSGQPL